MPSTRPTRIGLNLVYLKPGRVGGTETYARELIAAMARTSHSYEFVLFLNPQAEGLFQNLAGDRRFQVITCNVPAPAWARHVWEQATFSKLVREHRLDLLHSLAYVSPLRSRCAKVVTVHDMIYEVSGSSIGWARRCFWAVMVPLSARACDALITPSDNARQDVVRVLRCPPDRVRTVWLGNGQSWGEAAPWEAVQSRYSLPDTFFLAVGMMPHKRLDVIEAAAEILNEDQGMRVPVVVTGNVVNGRNGNSSLQPIGYVAPGELRTLYQRATALVCMSDLEGFGLPVLEAMALGTPVIAARRGSLPEIVAKAGITVDHGDVAALSEAMGRVLRDAELRAQLSRHGERRAQQFSWEKCAQQTLEVYRSVLESRTELA